MTINPTHHIGDFALDLSCVDASSMNKKMAYVGHATMMRDATKNMKVKNNQVGFCFFGVNTTHTWTQKVGIVNDAKKMLNRLLDHMSLNECLDFVGKRQALYIARTKKLTNNQKFELSIAMLIGTYLTTDDWMFGGCMVSSFRFNIN